MARPNRSSPATEDEQPPLGFDAHELVVDLWAALGSSVEGQFYSAADWQRARWELWYASR